MANAIQENRRKAVEWLRTTDLPQGTGSLYSTATQCYCALGHMGLAVGIDAKDEYTDDSAMDAYDEIENAFKLSDVLEAEILEMNDTAHKSLREIGDYLAAQWRIA